MLFVPSLLNWLVPAAIMHFAVPRTTPPAQVDRVNLKPGARGVIILFALTIATAVSFRNFLGLQPALGMMLGLGYLQVWSYILQLRGRRRNDNDMVLNSFHQIARVEWDTLLFFFGIIFAVGGLGVLGYLALASEYLYGDIGPTFANIAIGILSAIVDNIPLMFAVLTMDPDMSHGQWLLITLTAGVGGSLLVDRLGRRCRLDGPCPRRLYVFQPSQVDLGHRARLRCQHHRSPRHQQESCSRRCRNRRRKITARLRRFIEHEATSGLILVVVAALALLATNIERIGRSSTIWLIDLPVSVSIGTLALKKPLLLWINDGLMAVFFFLVALEIKREMLDGHLSSRDQLVLPAIAAVGGMIAPSLIYAYFNWHDPALLRGWAIPAATDIAFALGVLALLGSRVPLALKIFLLTLATLDDLLAILVIAFFYTDSVSLTQLALAAVSLAGLVALNRMKVSRLAPYIFIGIALWVFVLKSGVHATLAGVALGLLIPLKRKDGSAMIESVEEGLHPYVKFLILPLFAFVNAGVPLGRSEPGLSPHLGSVRHCGWPRHRQTARRHARLYRRRKIRISAACPNR